jgi:hypothetical protein
MLVNSPAECNLLAILRASGASQLQFRHIGLNGDDLGPGGCGPNVDHENFVLGELAHSGLFSVCSLDTKETAKKEVVDFKVSVDAWETPLKAENETDKTVRTAKSRVDTGTDT